MRLFLFAAAASSVTLARVAPAEIKICEIGVWQGYDHGYRTFALSAQDLAEMAANFAANPMGRRPIDYEHQTIHSEYNGQPAPAAGWMTAVEVRGTELWAKVEWTDKGKAHIEAGEYLYISPVICRNYVDHISGREIGTVLHSLGLTNTPFLENLPALAAKAVTAEQRRAACRAVGLPEDASDADLSGRLEGALQKIRLGEVALAALAPKASEDTETLAARLKAELSHPGMVPADQVTALRGELATLKADQLVAHAQSEGKIAPAQLDWLKGFARTDLDAAERWVAAAPKAFPGAAKTRAAPPTAGGTTTTEDERIRNRLGATNEEWVRAKARLEG